MATLPRLEAIVRRLMGRPSSASVSHWVYESAPSERGRAITLLSGQRRTLPHAPGLLSDAEIVRALHGFRFGSEFRGSKRVPIRALAEIVGLSHTTIYQAMRPDLSTRPRGISETTRIKLSFAIKAIIEGRLRFHRRGQVWGVEGSEIRTFEPRRRHWRNVLKSNNRQPSWSRSTRSAQDGPLG
jgi:hypothetical protein